jgi:hypothetical protein
MATVPTVKFPRILVAVYTDADSYSDRIISSHHCRAFATTSGG